jgi:uncharacterized phage-associated protein
MDWAYDEDKLAVLVLYVAGRLRDDPAGGATKLNKVLFFAEFAHMRRYGRPITGAEYQRLPWGPAPRRLRSVRESLVAAGLARLVETSHRGRPQHRLVPTAEVVPIGLERTELEVVDEIVDDFARLSASEVSQLSHDEEGWRMVDEGATIPYEAAFLRRAVVTEHVRRRAAAFLADRGDAPS